MSRKSPLLTTLLALLVAIPATNAATPLMVEKNLFSQERKPPSAETPAPTTQTGPPLPPKAIQLDGVMFLGTTKKALLRLKGAPNPKDKGKKESPFTTVREGEKVNDYTVTKIGTRSISLEKGGQTFEVFLYAEGKVLPPLSVSPPTAPGHSAQPPLPPRAQGQSVQPDQQVAIDQSGIPTPSQGPHAQAMPPDVQGLQGGRRAAMPPPPEPSDLDEGGEENMGQVDQ